MDTLPFEMASSAYGSRGTWRRYPAGIEPKYGDETLSRYADDIGVPYRTLDDYRRAAEAYEKYDRSYFLSWTAHQIFAAQPDRAELVKQEWTTAKAREEVRDAGVGHARVVLDAQIDMIPAFYGHATAGHSPRRAGAVTLAVRGRTPPCSARDDFMRAG